MAARSGRNSIDNIVVVRLNGELEGRLDDGLLGELVDR
jgi:hypothetical protein